MSILSDFYVSFVQMKSVKRYLILLTVVPIFPRRKTCSIRLRQDRSENTDSGAVVASFIKLSFPTSVDVVCINFKEVLSSYIRANKNNLCRGELAASRLLAIPSLSQSTHGNHSLHYSRQRHKFSESADKFHLNFLQSTLVVVCRTLLKIRMTECK